jgi:hypothetical protein
MTPSGKSQDERLTKVRKGAHRMAQFQKQSQFLRMVHWLNYSSFFFLSLVNTIAKQMQQHGIEDWVHPVESTQQNITDDNSNDEEESVGQDDEVEMDVDIEEDCPKQAIKFTPCKGENLNARH